MTVGGGTEPSFGDVGAEYDAARNAVGVVAGQHDLVWVEGPDAVSFLDGLLSQDVAGLESGRAGRSLLLAPQGKLRALLVVLRQVTSEGGRVGLLCDAGIGNVVVEDLTRFKIRVDASLETDGRPIADVIGPDAATLVRAVAGEPPPIDHWVEGDSAVVANLPFPGLDRYVVIGVPLERLVEAGARPVGQIVADTLRIEVGVPRMGVDVDDKTIPQEAGVVEGAVSFTKGCYLGQELVARIDSRGHVNRHLRAIVMKDNVLPPFGAEIVAGDKVVGAISTVGESMTLRAPVALGLIRREVEPGSEVDVAWEGGRARAVVRELPLVG